jgi:predicted MPP superfamily phosphohydrolase
MTVPLSRRKFLKFAASGTLSLSLVGVGGSYYSTRIEPNQIEVTSQDIALPHLAKALNGINIVHITDLHLGHWMTLDRMLAIAEQVNALNPDILAITGDLISHLRASTPDDLTNSLKAFKAYDGIFAVLGNHDYWTHAPTVRQAVYAAGNTQLLDNRAVVIERNGAKLYIAGVDDIWEQHHDLDAALASVPSDAPLVLLAHEPDYADEAAAAGRIGLQLSGHSHGGQIRLPGIGALRLPELGQKYDMGLYTINGMQLYVNRGVGMMNPYVRFNCRPEIARIRLVAS